MSESDTTEPSRFRHEFGRFGTVAGKAGLIVSLIGIALSIVGMKIVRAAPCTESALLHALGGIMFVCAITGAWLSAVAILVGLITLRLCAIAFGLAPVVVFLVWISFAVRSGASVTI